MGAEAERQDLRLSLGRPDRVGKVVLEATLPVLVTASLIFRSGCDRSKSFGE
jgi:hypothetical protein